MNGGSAKSWRMLRRLLIMILFTVIMVLLVNGSKRYRRSVYSYYEGPIRGHPMMKPLGSVCKSGSMETIVHSRHAIVLDAGSTGSRVHIYEFQYCGDRLTVLSDEVFAEVHPGLSSFADDPKAAAISLEPLIRQALERVPAALQSCTPLVLKATAGLRLLPQESVEAIIAEVRDYLDDHPFLLKSDADAVAVIDGSEEAVLAWITVNFLQQQFPEGHEAAAHGSTVVMEMGGGSSQIVFEATSPSGPTEYYYPIEYQGHKHFLYQHSYLGYGLMEARKAIKRARSLKGEGEVEFPCFPAGHQEEFDEVWLKGSSAGWSVCLEEAKSILKLGQPCSHPPCSFASVHQPSIYNTNGWRPIVAFSYIYSRITSLGLGNSTITLSQVASEAETVCHLRLDGPSDSKHLDYLRHQPHWCLDLAFIYSLLHFGYGIRLDHPITLVKQLHGYEAGWSLGSALRLLEHHPDTCPRLLPQ